ncbi:MAG: TetR/AcrR family transcriptional regulator [Myxococcales bacterium]|nr:TetR/AcrR family transcriptional regulator [Myxococcales bacterium]
MRERLLRATVDCLIERGYAGTTTTEIIAHAGVSRGAMLHHYPEKAALVTAAVEYVMERQRDEFHAALAALPPTHDFVSVAMDLLWAHFSSPLWHAGLELAVAARTDPALAAHVRPMTERFERVVERTAGDFFRHFTGSDEEFEAGRRFLYYFMAGLALAQVVHPDEAEARVALGLLKKQLDARVREILSGR